MWLDSSAEAALTQAVREIESQSSAEIAIAVRRSARSWPHVLFIAGWVAAWLTLAYMLFADPVYSLWTFLVDPLIATTVAEHGAALPDVINAIASREGDVKPWQFSALAAAHGRCLAEGVPLVAIGGIDEERLSEVSPYAEGIAVLSALFAKGTDVPSLKAQLEALRARAGS